MRRLPVLGRLPGVRWVEKKGGGEVDTPHSPLLSFVVSFNSLGSPPTFASPFIKFAGSFFSFARPSLAHPGSRIRIDPIAGKN